MQTNMSAEPKTTRKTPANRETFLFGRFTSFFFGVPKFLRFYACGGSAEIFPETYTIHIWTNANHPLGRWTSLLRTIYPLVI
jgi:hypothetical protein